LYILLYLFKRSEGTSPSHSSVEESIFPFPQRFTGFGVGKQEFIHGVLHARFQQEYSR